MAQNKFVFQEEIFRSLKIAFFGIITNFNRITIDRSNM